MESTEDQAVPGSSKDPMPSSSGYSCMGEFMVNERASFLNLLPSDIFGELREQVVCYGMGMILHAKLSVVRDFFL